MPRGIKRTFEQRITITLEKVMKRLQKALRKELEMQGHNMTGKLRDSVAYTIEGKDGKVIAEMTALNYGLILEVGVAANRIPFGGGRTGAKTSKYIEGLARFFQIRKGLNQKESLRAAFATARVHKREGMPSRGSYGYSRNGERKNWIKNTLTNNLEQIGMIIRNDTGATLELAFAENMKIDSVKFEA